MSSTAFDSRAGRVADKRSFKVAAGGLPRSQVGTTPQHLLMTLLGDYWLDQREPLPSAALVELLAEFEISQPSTRTALNRLTKRGLLVASKRGRNTYYGLTPHALTLVRDTLDRIATFGMPDPRPWDGLWTIVAFSVPESQRQLRHSIRTNLHWLGFAALFDGLWCSPWDIRDTTLARLQTLQIDAATVMRTEIDPRSAVQALSAWDLEAAKSSYLEFDHKFSPMLEEVRRGALTTSQALVARTQVMSSWRSYLGIEPDLPAELLPEDWPRANMRKLAFELYNSLAPVARARCQQIISRHAPELADLVTHHAITERL
jgi:phenylacetic acid degradation operon negative regulatory protein